MDREQVGIHHTKPRLVRALWRAYNRESQRIGNSSVGDWNPSRVARCRLSRYGDPYERDLSPPNPAPFARPVQTCTSAFSNATVRQLFPHCTANMLYVKQHPETALCHGSAGRRRCEGFQLDATDNCNVQYYLYCERLFKGSAAHSWCPPPQVWSLPSPPVSTCISTSISICISTSTCVCTHICVSAHNPTSRAPTLTDKDPPPPVDRTLDYPLDPPSPQSVNPSYPQHCCYDPPTSSNSWIVL